MSKTLFIVNPHAGRVRAIWDELKSKLGDWVSDYNMIMTYSIEELTDCINQAGNEGVEQIISVGGDGTNKFIVNAMLDYQWHHPKTEMIFGSIPAGTGRDFARGVGLPLNSLKAAEYVLTQAKPRRIDLGQAKFAGEEHFFLNVSSAGITKDIVDRVERSAKRPWAFFVSVVNALARYQPEAVQIQLDGEDWYEGNIYIMSVANGKSIGQGILIAPDADVDDGFFDVVVAEEMPILSLIQAFPSIYTGKHINHPKVKVQRAKHVRITTPSGQRIGMDLDGEPSDGAAEITYEIIASTLTILL